MAQKQVTDIRGVKRNASDCALIKGNYYQKGVDCEKRSDKWFRTDDAKALTKEEVYTETRETRPAPPPKVPVWTYTYADNRFCFLLDGELAGETTLTILDNTNSCGTLEINNLSGFEFLITNYDVPESIIKEAIIAWKQQLMQDRNKAFFIFSNNDETENINEIMDEIACAQTTYRLNTNSGNLVKIWILSNDLDDDGIESIY